VHVSMFYRAKDTLMKEKSAGDLPCEERKVTDEQRFVVFRRLYGEDAAMKIFFSKLHVCVSLVLVV